MFSNIERVKFLSHLVNGIKNILENSQGLSDQDNYHEFCRLLARLKTNYQLGELVAVESYPEIIQLIAKFTVQSLQVSFFFLQYYQHTVLQENLFILDVAICTKQRTLFAITLATYGCICTIC